MSRVIEIAHSAGIKAQLDPYPSLALGTCAISPLDMATAYATLARGGIYMEPQLVRRIQSDDAGQDRIFQATPSSVFPKEAVSQLVDALQDVVRYGTGTRAKLPGLAVAGKTGTADNGKDIWFVGFTPDTVTAVWGGSDRNLSVKGIHVTGGDVMARIWHDFMTSFYRFHEAPTQVVFAQPAIKLVAKLPHYDDAALLAGVADNANSDGDGSNGVRDRAVPMPVTDADQLQKIALFGIARAGDLQRAQAVARGRGSTMAESEATANNGALQRSIAPVQTADISNVHGTVIDTKAASHADDTPFVRDMVNNTAPGQQVHTARRRLRSVSQAIVKAVTVVNVHNCPGRMAKCISEKSQLCASANSPFPDCR